MFGKFSSLSLSRSGSKIKSLPINFYRKHIFVLYIFKPQTKKLCTFDKKSNQKETVLHLSSPWYETVCIYFGL